MRLASVICILHLALLSMGCAERADTPVAVDTKNDACHWCRMAISDAHLVVEVLDPGEEPRLFDDVACAMNELTQERQHPRNRRVFVTDYSTGKWLNAQSAVFERCPALDTPMGSHLVARTAASTTSSCTPVPVPEVFR